MCSTNKSIAKRSGMFFNTSALLISYIVLSSVLYYLLIKICLQGVVFVVDSGTFPKTQRDVAELLYDVLLRLPKSVPLLVACNKQDVAVAKSEQVNYL